METTGMEQTNRDMIIEGRWQQVKGRIKQAWGVITDDDLEQTEGRFDRLVGLIKEKTGETAEAIERRLQELTS